MNIEVTEAMLDRLGATLVDYLRKTQESKKRGNAICEMHEEGVAFGLEYAALTLQIPIRKYFSGPDGDCTAVKIGDKEYPVSDDPRRWEYKPESEFAP